MRQRFKYVYFLGPLSARLRTEELVASHLIDRLRLRILSGWFEANPKAKRDASIQQRIAQRLLVFQTKASKEAGHSCCRLPRYLAASNLLAEPGSAFFQFSAAFDRGSVPYPPSRANPQQHVPLPVSTGGWSYSEQNDDFNFREMFRKMHQGGLFVNPENKDRDFPKPR